jgi:hypothetical protein
VSVVKFVPLMSPPVSLTAAYGGDQRRGGDDITRNARATDTVDLFAAWTVGGPAFRVFCEGRG